MRIAKRLCRFLDSVGQRQHNAEIQGLQQLSAKEHWSAGDKQLILELLTTLLLDENFTESIASNFRQILKELLLRIERKNVSKHDVFIVLSKLVGYYSDVNEFVFTFFTENSYSPFEQVKQSKRRKRDEREATTQRKLLVASLNYLCFNPERFSVAWDWSPIFVYLENEDNDLRYLALQCLRIVCSMDDKHFFRLTSKLFDSEVEASLRVKYNSLFVTRKLDLSIDSNEDFNDEKCFIAEDFSKDVIPICDIMLSKVKNNCESVQQNFVVVPSFQEHLRSIALSLSFGEPVLIEGPVGCGKTSLVEYLANCTNRGSPPFLTKIQVGDQIDGKLLIGTHCCTDIPGEFVWKPGPLTECFLNGYWLLIEDIDCAPPDIVSTITSVIKTKSLSSVIGYPNTKCTANENFRIFFTRRLMSNHSETQSPENIYKLCNVVKMQPMNREELAFVINTMWPKLQPVTEKLIDIYYLIQETKLNEANISFVTCASRTVSLRDLLKWCNRISEEFRINSDKSAMSLFLNAADCFFQSLPSLDDRLVLAEKLGAQLNIASYTSRSLLTQRKPDIKIDEKSLNIGRVRLTKKNYNAVTADSAKPFFAYTHQSLNLLEKIGVCVYQNEPVLLVGETGTGKTSSIQYLAHLLNKKMTVINMNQQSDTCDLLGGYKPIEFKLIVEPLRTEFEDLFRATFDASENTKFLTHVSDCFHTSKWSHLFSLMGHVQKKSLSKTSSDSSLLERWKSLGTKIDRLQALGSSNPVLGFSYVEGSLIKAMVSGEWILLDEINLAETETLQCLAAILDSQTSSLSLFEKVDGQPIKRNPDFRLFACMNPATDVGKKELPLGIRNRFSEFYVEDLENESDLRILVNTYLDGMVPSSKVANIVKLYLQTRKNAEHSLSDANGARPHFSLRTLCRALKVCATNPCQNMQRSLFESFSLSFLTQLNRSSHILMESLITSHLLEKNAASVKKSQIPKPNNSDESVFCEGYWISKGSKTPHINPDYILTASVKKNIQDLSRIVSLGKSFPILLQGETSVGKTSLIRWLAEATGNVCVRVNNHEHTDLQEYVGTYCVDSSGKLCFKEGVLVEAMRKGYWIILDELNLASIEVLEALNRVLDDNRELFIPEKQEVVKAHPKFILFATQNPPENYAGRKMLSRAFRNRFVELHFDEIPCGELEVILHEKCRLPLSYAKKMVGVLSDLRVRRRESGVFYGKHSFITLRDLFRWGERYRRKADESQEKFYDWDLYLANEGFILLAARVRRFEEAHVVQEVLENRFKRKLDVNAYFDSLFNNFFCDNTDTPREFNHLVWTPNLKRLAVLMFEALKNKEPVLLIGDTGCGKTTICQLYSALKCLPFFTVNCHMHTESADFLGSLRPVRVHEENDNRLFEWVDGPLIQAMQEGAIFLVDEISLADDSVLERLNSVLEPERSLLLSERALDSIATSQDVALTITAKETFGFVATMNPGGDYGKKELSPALRNRFTEIWCQSEANSEDIEMIVKHNLSTWITSKLEICQVVAKFFMWFINTSGLVHVSIRDILSVVQFINYVTNPSRINPLPSVAAVYHSICLVVIDSIGSGNSSFADVEKVRNECNDFLKCSLQSAFKCGEVSWDSNSEADNQVDSRRYFGISPFFISIHEISNDKYKDYPDFVFNSPNATSNTLKLLRAMQISKPLLLEGAPGVGKTSLVQAVADATNHKIVRINLSEQTDIGDLFGADLPVEGSEGAFSWRDGPLLQALKTNGTWVVLDELNLASQSVLEGLNACLDHRGEIYIPELGKTFQIDKASTRIFACQNPFRQGGARKGLPQSFLNRFNIVFIDSLTDEDLIFIIEHTFPMLPNDLIGKMVSFNRKLCEYFYNEQNYEVQFEFNLRDLFRWCQLILKLGFHKSPLTIEFSSNLIYTQRFRNEIDRQTVKNIYEEVFGVETSESAPNYNITQSFLCVGNALLKRNGLRFPSEDFSILHRQLPYMESVMKCLEMNWMAILTGPSGIGKTTLVLLIGALTGQNIKVISMNPEMDATDLLGGFEQQDLMRHLTPIETSFWENLKSLVTMSLLEGGDYSVSMKLLSKWYNYLKHSQSVVVNPKSIVDLIEHLETIFNEIKSVSAANLNVLKQNLLSLKCRSASSRMTGSGIFEWVDSHLVNAVKNGDWVLIDDANLCAASVLDRLNALLEPGGSLILSEKGVVDNELCVIKPHPNFRLILAMNPTNGELSRAMRNRGIEIHVLSQANKRDIEAQLRVIGFNDQKMLNNLMTTYEKFAEDETDDFQLEKRFLNHCSRILCQAHRGFKTALDEQVYPGQIRNLPFADLKRTISDVLYASVLNDFFVFDEECNNYVRESVHFENTSFVENTKMQLFFENTSASDLRIRKLMVSNISKDTMRCVEKYFNDVLDSIVKVIGRKSYELMHLEELPVDIRSIDILWKRISQSLSEQDLQLLELNLNRWLLICFCCKLENIRNYERSLMKLSLLNISETKSSSSQPFDFVKYVKQLVNVLDTKIFEYFMQIQPKGTEVSTVKSSLLWFHHLYLICVSENSTSTLDEFLVLWTILNEKYITKPSLLFNWTSEKVFSSLTDSLTLNSSDGENFYRRIAKHNTTVSLYNCVAGAELFSKLNEVCNVILSLWNQRQINVSWLRTLSKLYFDINNDNNHKSISEYIEKVAQEVKALNASRDTHENEREDDELLSEDKKRNNAMYTQLTPLWNLSFCYVRVGDLTENQSVCLDIALNNNLLLHPFHECLLRNASLKLKNVHLFYYFLDFDRFTSKKNFNFWLTELEPDSDASTVDSDLGFTVECSSNVAKVCLKVISSSCSLGLSKNRTSQLKKLSQFLWFNHSILTSYESLNLVNRHKQVVKQWYSFINEVCKGFDFKSELLTTTWKMLNNQSDDIYTVGFAFSLIGFVSSHLFAPLTSVDPILRHTCKLNHYEMELRYIKTELVLRQALSFHKTGGFTSVNRTVVEDLNTRKEIVERKIRKLRQKHRVRPKVSQFHKLRNAAKHFLDTVFNEETFVNFMNCMKQESFSSSELNHLLRKSLQLQTSVTNFCNQLLSTYPVYYDLLTNFVIGLQIALQGIKIMTHELKKKIMFDQWNKVEEDYFKQCLRTLGCFAHRDPFVQSQETLNVLKWFVSNAPQISTKFPKSATTLFKCTFLELRNAAMLHYSKPSVVKLMSSVVDAFFNCWRVEQEKKAAEKEEEEALYKYKATSFEGELPEDEQAKIDIALLFPSFLEEYNDLREVDILSEKIGTESTNKDLPLYKSSTDLLEIFETHHELLKVLSSHVPDVEESNFLKPYKLRYEVLSNLLESCGYSSGPNIDSFFIEGAVLMCNQQLCVESSPTCSENTSFNIYKDCLPSELSQCSALLQALESRISELLMEFPGHPTLRNLLRIVNRMLGFSFVDSSVMKFVTGFELFVEEANEWESKAHRGISLRSQLTEITNMIIRWRKMELNNWKACLDSVHRKIEDEQLLKWWFHFYSTVTALLRECSPEISSLKDFISSLKEFMESSKLGEFHIRLDLLHRFKSYICLLDLSKRSVVYNILHNIVSFYQQFSSLVTEKINKEKVPIEKEVKDFVKIMRWNDQNFYAVKSAVAKSHKTLHRFMKNYERMLSQPSNQTFSSSEPKKKTDTPWRIVIDESILKRGTKPVFATFDFGHLSKVDLYFKKSVKFTKRIVSSTKRLKQEVDCINDLSSTVIETLISFEKHELPNQLTDKEKWRKAVKQLHHSKQQSLSALWKELSRNGLSFRIGSQCFNNFDVDTLLIDSLPVIASNHVSTHCASDLQSLNDYFFSSLSRFSSLRKVMQNPSKQISRNQFDRIKGFSGHFISLITKNKNILSDELRNLQELKEYNQYFVSSDTKVVNQKKMLQWIDVLHKLFIELKSSLIQVKDLLSCYPENSDNLLKLVEENEYFLYDKRKCDIILSNIDDSQRRLNDFPIHLLLDQKVFTDAHFHQLKALFEAMEAISGKFDTVLKELRVNSISQSNDYVAVKQLSIVCSEILNKYISFRSDFEKQEVEISHDEDLSTIFGHSQKLLLVVLSSVESMLKKLPSPEICEAKQEILEVNNAILNSCNIKLIRDCLNSRKVVRCLKTLFSSLNTVKCEKSLERISELMICLRTFLDQYISLCEYFVSLFSASQRTSCKLFYILLGLFNDLCTKGFCLPQEIEDEANNKMDGAKLKDISDAGFGEGEGTKDVSEKVESEDQLEDTFKDGKEVEEKGENKDEIEDEEQGIEMSEDFDAELFSPKANESNDENEDSESGEENDEEIDKKMGETEDNLAETIDERLWGSDEEKEEDEPKEDTGHSGGEDRSDPQVVAKDENRQDEKQSDKNNVDEDNKADEITEEFEEQDIQNDEYQGEREDHTKPAECEMANKEETNEELPEEMELDANELGSDAEETPMDEEVSENQIEDATESADEEMMEDDADKEEGNNASEAEMATEDNSNSEEQMNLKEDENDSEKHFVDLESNNVNALQSDENKVENSANNDSEQRKETAGLAETETEGNDGDGTGTFAKPSEVGFKNKQENSKKERRSLAEHKRNDLKRKQVIEASETLSDDASNENKDKKSELYQHINEGETEDEQVIDLASEEEENKYRPNIENEEAEEPSAEDQFNDQLDEMEEKLTDKIKEQKAKDASQSSKKTKQDKAPDSHATTSKESDEYEDIDKEPVKSEIVPRGPQSSIHTQGELLITDNEIDKNDKSWFENLVKVSSECKDMKDKEEMTRKVWKEVEMRVNPLVRELCQQLQLVLEPTKTSKLKGDYKTGKRLNMRKVIAYIASQFRKDKIWLRRTKPSKREYQIIVAIDDSLSMADNQSKQLAFESLALLAKSLTLIEAGEFAVMSFGDETRLLHSFDEPFTSSAGSQLLCQLQFKQQHTRISDLLSKALSLLTKHRRNTNADLSQLMLIISDGRGLFNEGETVVRTAVRRMKTFGVFVVFVVIDNPNNKDSILDIRVPVFNESGAVTIETYMEKFPFPFYLILRDIASMPHVLGEALRQWFELVTASDR